MPNTWNQSGTTWSEGRWGTQEAFTLGWGAKSWNDGEWGELNDITLTLTGQSLTSSIGSVTVSAEINTGWGQDGWGVENYGVSGLVVELEAPDGIESNLGANGWSNASYGENSWGMFTFRNNCSNKSSMPFM